MNTLDLLPDNQVFNPYFIYPNATNSFPAGWQKYQGKRFCSYEWMGAEGSKGSPVKIKNRFAKQRATIIQQRSFEIPVCSRQVWEIGAVMGTSRDCRACMIVHLTVSSSTSLMQKTLEFIVKAGDQHYYFDTIQIPSGVVSAYIEIGLLEAGSLLIDNVVFNKIFPVSRYDIDACSRLNINHVESLGRIVEPLRIQQPIAVQPVTLAKTTRDVHEEVIVRPEKQHTATQDVLSLSMYSYCIINTGNVSARVRLQLSPNSRDWVDDDNTLVIAGKDKKIMVSQFFLRYLRLQYWAETNKTTILQVYLQGQS